MVVPGLHLNQTTNCLNRSSQDIVAIIPARGGSKGIPQKNVRLIAGVPLLAHSIVQALRTPAVNRVVVSTDDSAIAEVARKWGADVIARPTAISEDKSPSESALLHALDHLRDTESYEPSLVVFLQATSPLRQPDDIQNSIHTLIGEQADSLFSACTVHGFVWRADADGLTSVNYDYRTRPRRQDMAEHYIENGSIYVFKPWVLRHLNNRLGGKIAIYTMRHLDSFQVDEPMDLELVETVFSIQREWGKTPDLNGIKLLGLDFDGVMTDNRVLVNQDGRESVLCDRSDGWGLARLKEAGIEVVVISTEANSVVAARCRKLRIDCICSCEDKLSALQTVSLQRSLDSSEIAFVGNDVNDLECLRWVGCPIAVADASDEVKAAARLVTTKFGGRGAVREVSDWLISQRSATPESINEQNDTGAK
jgi:YrbI family 3-deoxy-D-manno-octulosonate 8-phosphate phosphatase